MTNLYLDFEFTGLHKNTTPISIGIVAETGETFYAEFTDYDKTQVDDWIKTNVIDNLTMTDKINASCQGYEQYQSQPARDYNAGKYHDALEFEAIPKDMRNYRCIGNAVMIKNRLRKWLKQFPGIHVWGDVISYDWILFCDIFGNAFNIPENIYYIPFDIVNSFQENKIDPDINREEFTGIFSINIVNHFCLLNKHNSLWDAYVTFECHKKLRNIGNKLKCSCSKEISTGTTYIHCCNRCGKPTEEFWVKN